MFMNCGRAKGFTRGNVRICLLGTVTSTEKYLIELWSNVDAEWKAVVHRDYTLSRGNLLQDS
jgi:hypothetical protein